MTKPKIIDKEHSTCLGFLKKIHSIGHERELLDLVLSMKEKPAKAFCNAIALFDGPEKPTEDEETKKLNKAKALLKKYGPKAKTNSESPVGLDNNSPSFQDINSADKLIKHKLLLVKRAKSDTLKLHFEIADALFKLKPKFTNPNHFYIHIRTNFGISRR